MFNITNGSESDNNEAISSYGADGGAEVDIDYSFLGDAVEVKLLLLLNKYPSRSLLTVVRLDNVMECWGEYEGSYFNRNFADDRLWRDCVGWPNDLVVRIGCGGCGGGGGDKIYKIPSNPFYDSLQMHTIDDDHNDDACVKKVFNGVKKNKGNNDGNNQIPKIIHQIGSDRKGEPALKVVEKALMLTKLKNPFWEQRVVSIDEMGPLIEQLEGLRARRAFDKLKPMAYKADLYRYVVLYHYGGVYMDSKLVPRTSFDVIINESGGRSFIVRDGPSICKDGIQIALMGMGKGDPLMREAIDQLLTNVESSFYGDDYLSISGPKMLSSVFCGLRLSCHNSCPNNNNNNDSYYTEMILKDEYITTRGRKDIIYHNGEYRRMQHVSHQSENHYSSLWNQRQVYF